MDINNGGNLIINSPFTLSGGSIMNIATNDTLIIYGNTTLSGGSYINMNGYMIIYGNLNMTGGSGICDSGQGYVTGSVSGSGWCFTGTLPIELISFDAKKENDNRVILEWSTASETNNDIFTIERSIDGINFETISKLQGAGNSSQTLNYRIFDNEPLSGANYYRLRQTDFDGKFSFSKIVQVKIKSTVESLSCFPNPLKSGTLLHFVSPDPIRSVRIYNSGTNMILEKNSESYISEDRYRIDVETENLKPGVYFFTINTDNNTITSGKLIVQ